jgi:uncharacterized membrane protein
MEEFQLLLTLFGLLLGLLVFLSPIISLIGFLRARQLRETVAALEDTVRALDARVEGLARAQARMKTATPPPPAAVPAAAPEAVPATPVAQEVQTPPPVPRAPVPPVTIPAVEPPPAAVTPPPTQPVPVAVPPPAEPMPPPLPAAAAPSPRATWPPPPPPSEPGDRPAGPPRRPIARPPAPPPGAPPAPAVAFDWESMLGVRGGLVLGGIFVALAALYFAKLSYDHGYFTPILRVIVMILAGTAALVWAEIGLRRRYQPTADAISGAGLVSLYAGWYAAHVSFGLIESPLLTFAAMSVTTLVAAGISVRHGAAFTAILGLLGGLATPILLSNNSNNPLGLFLYLAVLNTGFLWVARNQAWTFITAIALVGTSLMEFGWMATRLSSETLPIAVIGIAVLGAIYMWHAVATGDDEAQVTSHVLGFVGGLLPLGLAVVLAADRRFVEQWPWVLGNLVILAVAAIAIGVMRLRLLVLLSAAATALACFVWSAHVGAVTSPVGPAMVVLLLTALYNVLGRLWPAPPEADGSRPALSLLGGAGLIVAAGLALFSLSLLAQTLPPPGLVIGIVALLFLVGIERTSVDVGPLVLPATAAATGIIAQLWFQRAALPGQYIGLLAFAHVLAIAYAAVAFVRDRLGVDARAPWVLRADLAVLVAAVLAYLGLHGALARPEFAAPAPLFALLGLDVALVLLVAIRRAWTPLVPLAALAACFFAGSWHALHFTLDTGRVAVVADVAIYVLFMALPFVLTAAQPAVWRRAAAAWLTSALIGPALFLLFRAEWLAYWGPGAIGLLAVILAAGSVLSLAGVSRIFDGDEAAGDPEAAGRRLNYLALFAAIALGFVAAAIALQLEKQWLTIGWALEAAAVFWLFGLVPHPGLKYLGLVLFGIVGARLIVNPEVLRYEPRGAPIVNWLLYTYGVPVLATFAGAWLLHRVEARRGAEPEYDWAAGDRTLISPVVAGLGLVLFFVLINVEIADFFSQGTYLAFDSTPRLERDLAYSIAWSLYSLLLLGIGIWRGVKGLRVASLIFLMLTVGKAFLYDLSALKGIYRVLSFLGLGTALILVSLLYQRFAGKKQT